MRRKEGRKEGGRGRLKERYGIEEIHHVIFCHVMSCHVMSCQESVEWNRIEQIRAEDLRIEYTYARITGRYPFRVDYS